MTKETMIAKLNVIKRDILDYSYIEDWDGDSEDGAIIRKVYTGMSEDDMRLILDKIQDIIWEMNKGE